MGSQRVRWLLEMVKNDASAERLLRSIIWDWCVELTTVTEENWPGQVKSLGRAIRPIVEDKWNEQAENFCKWSTKFVGEPGSESSPCRTPPNFYRFMAGERFVEICVGTIHSAKGQTHTATLVLETFFKEHDLEDLLPWLLGEKHGTTKKEGIERVERLRLIYTAMTRPTHLLCMAMRQDAVANAKQLRLQSMGWRVQIL